MESNTTPKITLVIPVFGRPARTLRAIKSALDQTLQGYELLVIGDGCQKFQQLIDSGYFISIIAGQKENGNEVVVCNLSRNYGHYGTMVRNVARLIASAPYLCFLDNDDKIDSQHLETYYNGINGTGYDIVYFNSILVPLARSIRNSELVSGKVGHSECVYRTELLRKLSWKPFYSHDWDIIQQAINVGAKISKSDSPPTYRVCSLRPKFEEDKYDV